MVCKTRMKRNVEVETMGECKSFKCVWCARVAVVASPFCVYCGKYKYFLDAFLGGGILLNHNILRSEWSELRKRLEKSLPSQKIQSKRGVK